MGGGLVCDSRTYFSLSVTRLQAPEVAPAQLIHRHGSYVPSNIFCYPNTANPPLKQLLRSRWPRISSPASPATLSMATLVYHSDSSGYCQLSCAVHWFAERSENISFPSAVSEESRTLSVTALRWYAPLRTQFKNQDTYIFHREVCGEAHVPHSVLSGQKTQREQHPTSARASPPIPTSTTAQASLPPTSTSAFTCTSSKQASPGDSRRVRIALARMR